jgi:hypothetical protein
VEEGGQEAACPGARVVLSAGRRPPGSRRTETRTSGGPPSRCPSVGASCPRCWWPTSPEHPDSSLSDPGAHFARVLLRPTRSRLQGLPFRTRSTDDEPRARVPPSVEEDKPMPSQSRRPERTRRPPSVTLRSSASWWSTTTRQRRPESLENLVVQVRVLCAAGGEFTPATLDKCGETVCGSHVPWPPKGGAACRYQPGALRGVRGRRHPDRAAARAD